MMKNLLLAGVVLAVVLSLTGCPAKAPVAPTAAPPAVTPPAPAASGGVQQMKWQLSSPAFQDGQPIPVQYTGFGKDVSPPLEWSKPPEGTVELVLVCDDLDAPSGTWVHWVVWGMPATVSSLPEGVAKGSDQPPGLQGGRQGTNDFRKIGYYGPKPPPGKVHHYHFKIYALNEKLNLPAGADKPQLAQVFLGKVLDQAELVGTFTK
jgi:Raf kinase inhibitor-like YbhB/YbcL family protein